MDMHKLLLWVLGLLSLAAFPVTAKATPPNVHGLGNLRRSLAEEDSILSSLETFYYNQTLDHFNYQPQSFVTFPQRYLINSKYWGGSDAPIFVYLGGEDVLEDDIKLFGFIHESAPRFKALVVYLEHRFYGKSVPFVSQREVLNNNTLRGYFNIAQALADYAEILLYLKHKLSAPYSPIIVIGASYGGMLAAWFRLKYPHVAVGALASSAPILYLDEIVPPDGFFQIVSRDYRESSRSCYETIKGSWDKIAKVASQPNGLSILSKKFKSCGNLSDVTDLTSYLVTIYVQNAKFDIPPIYPVDMICRGIDEARNETDILDRIFAGLVAIAGNSSCYINASRLTDSNSLLSWSWQTCSDLVFTISTGNDTMFPPSSFDIESYIEQCKSAYGVPPRPHWVTTYFGGHDIKLVLKRFGSNIVLTNGLRDPWSAGGILEDISDSIIAVVTKNGSHALDMFTAKKTDPEWLMKQRNTSLDIIEGWIYK
nr:lysosomal Pro-X carboxypeptidase [Ipomoea batatas]